MSELHRRIALLQSVALLSWLIPRIRENKCPGCFSISNEVTLSVTARKWWRPRQLQPHHGPIKSRVPVYCGLTSMKVVLAPGFEPSLVV
jgi:hypothetical protein